MFCACGGFEPAKEAVRTAGKRRTEVRRCSAPRAQTRPGDEVAQSLRPSAFACATARLAQSRCRVRETNVSLKSTGCKRTIKKHPTGGFFLPCPPQIKTGHLPRVFISNNLVFGHNPINRLRMNMYPYNRQHWAIFHTNIDHLFARTVRSVMCNRQM